MPYECTAQGRGSPKSTRVSKEDTVIDTGRFTLYLCRQLSPILLFLSMMRHDMPIACSRAAVFNPAWPGRILVSPFTMGEGDSIPAPTMSTCGSSSRNSCCLWRRSCQFPLMAPPRSELFPPCGRRYPAISSAPFSSLRTVYIIYPFQMPSAPWTIRSMPEPRPALVSKSNMDSIHSRPSIGFAELGANWPFWCKQNFEIWAVSWCLPMYSVNLSRPWIVRKSH